MGVKPPRFRDVTPPSLTLPRKGGRGHPALGVSFKPFGNDSLTQRGQPPRMLVRSRARALIAPLLIYLALGSASAYLVKNASRGQNGAEARAAFDREQAALKTQLADLEDQRDRWRHRVESLRNESIDRDLLEQEAHARLNRVYKEEVLIFTGAQTR